MFNILHLFPDKISKFLQDLEKNVQSLKLENIEQLDINKEHWDIKLFCEENCPHMSGALKIRLTVLYYFF